MKKIIELLKSKLLWFNIIAVILILIVLFFAMLMFLKFYTNHGESIKVPNLIGLYENEAVEVIKKEKLQVEIIDSVFLRNSKSGVIVEQTPKQGSNVKHGRIIYLTINAKSKRTLILPNLVNVSQRQATNTLTAMGFGVNVKIVPSEYSDVVLEITQNGRTLNAGDKLQDGAVLTLTVGKNNDYDGEMIFVPSLTGLSFKDAENAILTNHLVIGYTGFDVQPKDDNDKLLYKVYKQSPSPNESVIPGKRIDIWLSKDARKIQQRQEDDFF